MIPIVAWRNIWRHKVRSAVVILSIAVGLWAGAFMMAFSWGMYDQYMRETVETQLSHLQLHHPLFEEDHEVQYFMPGAHAVTEHIRARKEDIEFTERTLSTGMASSPSTASGVTILGISPEQEDRVTKLASRIVEGKYLDSVGRNPLLIGEKLAQKLKVKLKNKVILTFQDTSGEIVAGAFRVAGIYRSKNSRQDEMNVYVRSSDLNRMLSIAGAVHEIAILLKDGSKVGQVQAELKKSFPEVSIKSWKQLSPELELVIDSFNEFMYIFVGIIMLALTFGIVNTMLMTVLERVREIGMLMAIGMTRVRIFSMIMLEAVYLALVGGPMGLLLAYVTIEWTGKVGIDISIFSKGLSDWGFSSIVYPALDTGFYGPLTVMTVGTTVLSAIYPAIRALRLKPAEAIRKI